jgi:hypothetical protein
VKVVIAGGSGLIGAALCRSLLADGHEVVVLTRATGPPGPTVPGVRLVTWRPPHLATWTSEIREATAIINLAGASIGRWPWTAGRMRLLRESRVAATRALVGSMAGLPASRRPAVLLNASGTDVYEGRDETAADESARPGRSFLARLCLDWEAEALRSEPLGVRVVLLRTSSVIAPDAPFLRVVSLPVRLLIGGRIGSGAQWVSWADMADVVGLYRLALESRELRGPCNVAAPDPRRQHEFARALGATLGRPSRFWTPAWVVRLVLGRQATLALGSRRAWPAKALAAGYVFQRPRLEDALSTALRRHSNEPFRQVPR